MLSTKKEKNEPMQVFVRVRPLNKQEGNTSVVDTSNREVLVKHHGGVKKYMYDRVFGPDSKQIDVYKLVAEPTVKEVMSGYNCTVLAYGQTGTGKTYTMAGGTVTELNTSTSKLSWFEDVHSGIIPRTLAHLFDELRVHQCEYTVRVSYLELYNEEIFDLLSPVEDNTKLKLYDDSMKKGSVIVQGLTETTVNSKLEVYRILEKGAEKRKIASTLMNANSSRSHTVFCITVHTKENSVEGSDLLKTGKLYLVDLAGSENIKQSGAKDVRAREAVSINQSLLTLGRVITKLIDHSAHIPYRESKLTRLLQDSLGGRTKTTLIATVSPAACNTEETLNTLNYAHQAKSITNKPEINQRLSKKALLKEYTEEIERLRKDLVASRNGKGVYIDEENYDSLLRERDVQKEELAEKIGQIRVMQDQMAHREQLCETLKISLEEHQREVEVKELAICTLESQLHQASKEITGLQEDNELKQFLVDKYSETEAKLKTTAKELLTVADTTTGDTRKLHDKLDVLADLTKQNKQICEQHITEFNSKVDGIANKLRLFYDNEYMFHKNLADMLATIEQTNTNSKIKSQQVIDKLRSLGSNTSQQKTEVDCAEQSTQIAFELVKHNISNNFETAKAECLTRHESLLLPEITELCDGLVENAKFVNGIVAEWRQMIAQSYMNVDEFIGSLKNQILETKDQARKHVETEMHLCAQIQEQIENEVMDKETYKSALDSQYMNVLKSLEYMKTLSEQYAQSNNDKCKQRLRDLSGLRDNLQDLHNEFTKNSESACEFIDQFADSLQYNNQKHHSDIDETQITTTHMTNRLNKSVENVNSIVQVHTDLVTASYRDIEEACKNEVSTQGNLVGGQLSKHSSVLQQIENEVVELKCELELGAAEFEDAMGSSADSMRTALKENDTLCSEVDSVVSTELDTCRQSFRRLYTSSLKEYKATGETPQRRYYRYPRSFVETKPDKLVEEYQQTRRAATTVPRLEQMFALEEEEDEVEKENLSNGNETSVKSDTTQHEIITTKTHTQRQNLRQDSQNEDN